MDLVGKILCPQDKDTPARGRLRVEPIRHKTTGKTVALRATLMTPLGVVIREVRAPEVEVQVIEFPDPDAPKDRARIKQLPGTVWFYGPEPSQEIGFLPDNHARALALPHAIEKPKKGRTPKATASLPG